VRIARPILLVSTIGVVFGGEAWRLAARMALMAAMVGVVGALVWMTVRTIRRERDRP
jgi:hypothetical protein